MDEIEHAAERLFTQGVARMNALPPDLPGAVSCFSRALFLAPTAAPLHAHRGEALLRLCDLSAALLSFRRAHTLAPTDGAIRARLAQLHYMQGRLHLDAGETEHAAAEFSEALVLQPRYSDCWLLRIKAWIRVRSYGRALHELNAFITHEDSEGYFREQEQKTQRSSLEKRNETHGQDSKEEEQHHHGGEEDDRFEPTRPVRPQSPDRALPANLDDATAAEPPLLRARSVQAAASTASNATAVAAVSSSDGVSELSVWRTVQALLLRAKLHVLLERSDLALRDAGWAHALDPSNVDVAALLQTLAQKAESLYGTATAHVLAGQHEQAIGALTRALELNPNDVRCYSMRAALLRARNRFDESLKDLKDALQITVALRQARNQMQKRNEAAAAAASGVSAAPAAESDDHEAKLAGGQTFLSEVALGGSGVDDGAVAAATAEDDEKDEQQLALEKSLALTFNGLGVSYYEQGDAASGLSCLSRALELDGKVGAFFANRGDCLLALGQEDQALSDFHAAARIEPSVHAHRAKIGAIHASRGRTLFNACRYEEACAELGRALGADPVAAGHWMARARTLYALHRYEGAYRDAEEAVRLRPGDLANRAFLLQLRQSLLRPADVARAPPLPPVPTPDTPFNPARAAAAAARSADARPGGRRAGGATASSAYVPSIASANAARQGRRSGADVLRLVFGSPTGNGAPPSDAASGVFVKLKQPPVAGRRAR
jgi:tetratricopeptide (TPR) repeat protein